MKGRIIYMDAAKCLAIMMIVVEHCSEILSGKIFATLCGVESLFSGYHTAIFAVVSGFFINEERVRKQGLCEFGVRKARSLLLPPFVFYLLCCIATLQMPSKYAPIGLYWFLTSLFVCFMLFWMAIRVDDWIKKDGGGIFLLLLIVLAVPYFNIVQINYLFPLMLAGFVLRKKQEKFFNYRALIVSSLILIILYSRWNSNMTVYVKPFYGIQTTSFNALAIYVYQLVFGFTGAVFIISICWMCRNTVIMRMFAKIGLYTLFIYVLQVTLFDFIRYFKFDTIELESPQLDVVSFVIGVLLCFVISIFARTLNKNKNCNILFLGK